MANALDSKGFYLEASELDKILSDLCSDEMSDIIEKLEDTENSKKSVRVDKPEKEKQKSDVVPNSTGHVGSGLIDNPNSGMGQGFSEAYMYSTFGDLS